MIGVIANPADHPVVREFFELFKTPWEFYRSEKAYPVVLCAGGNRPEDVRAELVIAYSGGSQRKSVVLSCNGRRLPVYCGWEAFPGKGSGLLDEEKSGQPVVQREQSGGRTLVRIGYDLFNEVRMLLTAGQPADSAGIPALDLHIAFLRDLIIGAGVPLVEIPPAPDGHSFIACLTHDVDHPAIRLHKWNHTMFGFLYRAVVGSVVNVFRGRMSLRSLLANWAAAAKLPLVHLGLAKDTWNTFDRYLEIERGLASTFFVIPFKGRPGRSHDGSAPRLRASAYGADDIAPTLRKLAAAGCEVGVHGIDAWLDSARGREELEEVRRAAGTEASGMRMHWLCWDEQQSPVALEQAGFAYDSTVGYNQAVGFRSGTAQAYKPLNTQQVLEIPLHVMDTALFYPDRLGLSPSAARRMVSALVDDVERYGGALTINWHDRSIAPERLWDAFYIELVEDLKRRQPWFATARQAAAWFEQRRSARFESIRWEADAVHVKASAAGTDRLPGLRLRVHTSSGHRDIVLRNSIDARIPLAETRRAVAEVRS